MGSEARKKSKVIGVRLSDEELAEVQAKAANKNVSLPTYFREAVLEKVETVGVAPRRKFDLQLLSISVGALGKIGNNLNQIARRLNEGGGVGLERIAAALEQLEIAMKELLKIIKAKPYDSKRQKPE
jgi:cyclopropane fatty-acyl-phospholipid synthase-like methyltransferase